MASRSPDDELLHGSYNGYLADVVSALERGANVNCTTANRQCSALSYAAQEGHTAVVGPLLSAGASVNAVEKDGNTPLTLAVQNGHATIVEMLIAARADVHRANRKGTTPLIYAASLGHTNMVEALLAAGAKVDDANERGLTPLYSAAQNGHIAIVDILLLASANVDHVTKKGNSALTSAAYSGHTSVVDALLTAGASVDIVDGEGDSALVCAACRGHEDVVRLLVEAGADPGIRSHDGMTAVSILERQGLLSTAQFVRDYKASPEAFVVAVRRGNLDVVRRVVNAQLVSARGKDARTPLHHAIKLGHTAVIKELVEHGADLTARDGDGSTPLHLACVKGTAEVVALLLEKGSDPAAMDDRGLSCVHVAVQNGNLDAVHALLAVQAEVHGANDKGTTPLIFAAAQGDATIIETLLAAGAKVNGVNERGLTALNSAAQNGHAAIVDILLLAGANVDHITNKGDTSLTSAAYNGHTAVVDALLAAGASVDIVDGEGDSALICTARRGHEDIVRLLVEAGADPTIRSNDGMTAVSILEKQEGLEALAQFVRDHQPSPETFVGAVRRGNLDVVRRLVNAQMVSSRGTNARSPLHHAIKLGQTEVVSILIENGANLAARERGGSTPLHLACGNGTSEMIALLLEKGCDPTVVDDRGLSCVHVAVYSGRLDAVHTLVDHGAKLSTPAIDNRTALHFGVLSRHVEVLEYLLKQGSIDVNAVDIHGFAALHDAVRPLEQLPRYENETVGDPRRDDHDSRIRMVRALVATNGVNVNVQDSNGKTALFTAAQCGFSHAVHVLLEHGARTDIATRSAKTPLSVATSVELRDLLQVYHNSQQFHDKCFAFLNNPDTNPTIGELTELVPLITSVYDARLVLTLAAIATSDASRQAAVHPSRDLLKQAFTHILSKKYTYDDEACVFFKLALEHCEREGILPRSDVLLLDRQAEKVNTESANWVMEMKKQVHLNSWRLDSHDQHLRAVLNGLREVHSMVMENRKAIVKVSSRVGNLQKQVRESKKLLSKLRNSVTHIAQDMSRFESRLSQSEANIEKVATSLQNFRVAYVDRLRQEERNEKLKRMCGIVASVAGFVFAPVLKEVAGAFVDVMNPIEIVEKLLGEADIAKFVSEGTDKAFSQAVQEQLEKYAIPKDEFETLLREEIVLQHPEYLVECERRGLPVDVDGGQSDVARSVKPTLDLEEVALLKLVGELQAALGDDAQSTRAPPPPHQRQARSSPPHAGAEPFVPSSSAQTQQQPAHDEKPAVPAQPTEPHSSTSPNPTSARSSPSYPDESPLARTTEAAVVLVGDANTFPYHLAVRECHGHLPVFKELVEMVDASTCDPTVATSMELCTESTSRKTVTAAEYAYLCGFHDIGQLLVARMTTSPVWDKTPAKSVSLLADPNDFPFVLAVVKSQGNVDDSRHFLELLDDEDDHLLHASVDVEIVREVKERVEWTAVQYACHLGYVDVVGHLLKGVFKASMSMTAKFDMLKDARANSVRAAQRTTSGGTV